MPWLLPTVASPDAVAATAATVPAPISRGDMLGQMTVSGKGVPTMNVPLLAGADVGRLGLPGRAVAVRQGPVLATAFHPELTGDLRVHALFCGMVRAAASAA